MVFLLFTISSDPIIEDFLLLPAFADCSCMLSESSRNATPLMLT